jgi:hypothetical protein
MQDRSILISLVSDFCINISAGWVGTLFIIPASEPKQEPKHFMKLLTKCVYACIFFYLAYIIARKKGAT